MKILALVLLAVGFFYLFYCGAMALWSYFEVAGIVDRAVEERGRVTAAPVREAILKGVAASGLVVDDREVVVDADERGMAIRVRWAWPVLTYKGEQVVEIPLSLERSFAR